MSVSFLSPNRTVMLVTDDAAYIYAASARGVRLVEAVPWDSDKFDQHVARILSKECGGKPVLILNDMVEQHYRKERVLRTGVGMLDKAGMLKRKLNITFPNYPVKAGLPLKEKPAKGEKKIASDLYIFAAVPDTRQFVSTISSVNLSLAPIAGFCLLPVESADLLQTLSSKLQKKGEPKSRWVLLVGQHKNGGLRQIVTKNGELALTRMTPIVENDNDTDMWVGEVLQEFKATMSYLTRFGFQPEDGLHVIVIGNAEAGEALERQIEESCKYSCMTSVEAARLLNIPLGPQDDPRYADALHIAWAGRKSRFILPMKAKQIESVSKPRQMATAASVVLVCGLAFLGYQLLTQFAALSQIHSDMSESKSRLAQLTVQYEKEVQRKEALGFDVRLVQSSIRVHSQIDKDNIKPLSLFNSVGTALGRDMRLDRVIIEKPDGSLVTNILNAAQQEPANPVFLATLQMTYPSTTNIDKGNKEVGDLKARLESLLPGHVVEVTKYLKDYEYVEEVVVETGDLQKQNVSQDFVAEIKIKGPPPQVEAIQ